MKHLLKLGGMTPEEILHILDVACLLYTSDAADDRAIV